MKIGEIIEEMESRWKKEEARTSKWKSTKGLVIIKVAEVAHLMTVFLILYNIYINLNSF